LKVKVAAGEFRARFPEITLLPARLIAAPAWAPRFGTLMALVALTPASDRTARLETLPVRSKELVKEIEPVPVVANLRVVAVTRPSCALVRRVVPEPVVPTTKDRFAVKGLISTKPEGELNPPVIDDPVSNCSLELVADNVPEKSTVGPINAISPAAVSSPDFRSMLELWVVMFMSPPARIAVADPVNDVLGKKLTSPEVETT
jgi:hypothetical protein